MTLLTHTIRLGVASVLPLASLVAVAACSSSTTDPENTSDGPTVGGTQGTATVTNATSASAATTGGANNNTTSAQAAGSSNATTGAATTGGVANNNANNNTVAGPVTVTATASGTGGAGNVGTEGPSTASTTEGAGGNGAGGNGAANTTGSTGPTFHIFMLMGQSNMAGVAVREASDNNTDERLKILGGCNQPAGQWNVASTPPLNDCPGEKGWNTNNAVDPGIWFGKTLLEHLPEGDSIGLIGTAESGESINTFVSGGSHHQMILNKINTAKTAENGRFAGIIFHQGESDSGQSSWPGKVVQLYNEVKAAWGVDYDVPFILGELPAGGCCSGHNTYVHQAAEQLPDGHWITQDGTGVLSDALHFDHASVVLMGQRYGESMIEALGW